MKSKIVGLLAGAMIMVATSAMATMMPSASGAWTGAGATSTIDDFLALPYFSSNVTLVSPVLDLKTLSNGAWAYTAIGHESGNINLVEESATPGYSPAVSTFNTSDYSNWGTWETINFNSSNLFFEDSDGPYNTKLNPFNGSSIPGFKVYQLTADSTALGYLPGDPSLVLKSGTYIVGYCDNTGIDTDGDYDDIIIALAPAVPEPGTMMLLGIGMLGMAVYGKRRMNK